MTCLVISKELVFRDMKLTIISVVMCAFFSVSEKQSSGVSLLADREIRRSRRTVEKVFTRRGFEELPVLSCSM